MNQENTKPEHTEAQSAEPGGPGMTGCCGPEMAQMMKDCPCASAVKSHRAAIFAALSVVALAFLISQIGGVLGIIGFFRTF